MYIHVPLVCIDSLSVRDNNNRRNQDKMENETKTSRQAGMLLTYIKHLPLESIDTKVRSVLLHDLKLIANPNPLKVTLTDTVTPRWDYCDPRFSGGAPLSGKSSSHKFSKTL